MRSSRSTLTKRCSIRAVLVCVGACSWRRAACVYAAGYIVALVGWHVLLGRPLPDPIAEEWAWLAAGHWPCDYADEPPGFGDASPGVRS